MSVIVKAVWSSPLVRLAIGGAAEKKGQSRARKLVGAVIEGDRPIGTVPGIIRIEGVAGLQPAAEGKPEIPHKGGAVGIDPCYGLDKTGRLQKVGVSSVFASGACILPAVERSSKPPIQGRVCVFFMESALMAPPLFYDG